MSETPAVYNADNAALLETVLVKGDLKDLSPAQRLSYYKQVCDSVGLNPLTKPFQYITLNGRLTLYATRDATDQLRGKPRMVNITKLERETTEGVYVVTAYATDKDGRTDSSIGAVAIEGLKGEARANAMMKAETKAKRRVTLSLCGLGMLDETEIDSIPDAKTVQVSDKGEIVTPAQLNAAMDAKPKPAATKPPTHTELIMRLVKAEEAFEDAGLTYTHPKEPEAMSDEELTARIAEMRAQYRTRGQSPAEEAAG